MTGISSGVGDRLSILDLLGGVLDLDRDVDRLLIAKKRMHLSTSSQDTDSIVNKKMYKG